MIVQFQLQFPDGHVHSYPLSTYPLAGIESNKLGGEGELLNSFELGTDNLSAIVHNPNAGASTYDLDMGGENIPTGSLSSSADSLVLVPSNTVNLHPGLPILRELFSTLEVILFIVGETVGDFGDLAELAGEWARIGVNSSVGQMAIRPDEGPVIGGFPMGTAANFVTNVGTDLIGPAGVMMDSLRLLNSVRNESLAFSQISEELVNEIGDTFVTRSATGSGGTEWRERSAIVHYIGNHLLTYISVSRSSSGIDDGIKLIDRFFRDMNSVPRVIEPSQPLSYGKSENLIELRQLLETTKRLITSISNITGVHSDLGMVLEDLKNVNR